MRWVGKICWDGNCYRISRVSRSHGHQQRNKEGNMEILLCSHLRSEVSEEPSSFFLNKFPTITQPTSRTG
jgi:hypothetical protein